MCVKNSVVIKDLNAREPSNRPVSQHRNTGAPNPPLEMPVESDAFPWVKSIAVLQLMSARALNC